MKTGIEPTGARRGGPRPVVLRAVALVLSLGPPLGLTPLPAAAVSMPQEPGREGMRLSTGSHVARELASGGAERYFLDLEPGDFVTIIVEPRGIDLAIALSDPNARVVTNLDFRHGGRSILSTIARTSGRYELTIRSLDTTSVRGAYSLEVHDLRPARPEDEQRAIAVGHWNRAEALRMAGDASARAAAAIHYRQAAESWQAAGDLSGQALAARRLGEVQQLLGNLEEARPLVLQSLDLSRQAGDHAEECAALVAAARVDVDLGHMTDATQFAEKALELARRTGNQSGEAEAMNALGDVYMFSGRNKETVSLYRAALSISQALLDRRGQARALLNLGYAHTDLSEIPDAQSAYEAALNLWRAVGEARGQGLTLTGLGRLHAIAGENQRALDCFREASSHLERAGDRIGMGDLLAGIGVVYFRLGEPQTALGYFRRAVDIFRETKLPNGEGGNLWNVGMCLASLGRYGEALEQYSRARDIFRSLADPRMEAPVLEQIGRMYVELGDVRRALAYYRDARSLAQVTGDRRTDAAAANGIGELLLQQGRHDEALTALNEALPLAARSGEAFAESAVLYNLARTEAGLGHMDTALARSRSSLALVESLRSTAPTLDLRASYLASVRDRYELEIDLLMRPAEADAGARSVTRAFEASEQARARSFLDSLAEARAGIHEGVAPELLERERRLRNSLNAKALRLTQARSDRATTEQIADLQREVDNLSAEYRDVEAQIRSESPRYAALVQPKPLGADEVRASVVDRDSVLLQYFLGKERSYVWAVTPDGVTGHTLPGRDEIEQRVRAFRDALTAPATTGRAPVASGLAADVRALERALSATLLDPVAPQLNRPRVVIVADGILQVLPFSALTVPAHTDSDADARVPLIADREIVYLPSASTLALIRGAWKQEKRWPKSVRVFADPVFEADDPRLSSGSPRVATSGPAAGPSTIDGRTDALDPRREALKVALRDAGASDGSGIPRLLEARREARSIAAIAPGADVALDFDASLAAARDPGLAEYRVIHFATHGLVDDRHPELSGVVLSLFDSKGEAADGFLRLNDIYNLHLPVDLVVLSACSTALGKEIVGEGLVGLVRGFMYAGSRRVLASLWKVDDEATSELMTRFYRGLFEKNLSPSAALRAAQLEMLGMKRWSHPFYWAGFVLQGEWN